MQTIKLILDWIVGLTQDSLEDSCLDKARLRYHAFAFVMIVSATLSGVGAGYLVFYVFRSVAVSLLAGAFWAVAIFLCERFLVLSMDETLTWRNAIFGLQRVGFAFLVASTMVVPLELRFYDSSVVNRISSKATAETNAAAIELTNFYAPIRERLEARKTALESNVNNKRSECEAVYKRWHAEKRGVVGESTSGKEGNGRWAHLAEEELKRCEDELAKLVEATTPKLAEVNGKLEQIQVEYDRRFEERVESIKGATGLLDRIEAFEDIVREHPTLWNKTTMLWLLLCVFESLPVLGKIMFARRLTDEEAEKIRARQVKDKIKRDLDLLLTLAESKTLGLVLRHREELARQGSIDRLDSAAARYKSSGPAEEEYSALLARIAELGSYRRAEAEVKSELPN